MPNVDLQKFRDSPSLQHSNKHCSFSATKFQHTRTNSLWNINYSWGQRYLLWTRFCKIPWVIDLWQSTHRLWTNRRGFPGLRLESLVSQLEDLIFMAPLHYITILYGNLGSGCRIFGNRQSRQEASNYIFYVDSGETNTRFCDFKSYCLLNELSQHSHPIYNLLVRNGAAPARSTLGDILPKD